MFIRDDAQFDELDSHWVLRAVQYALFRKVYNPVSLKLALFGA